MLNSENQIKSESLWENNGRQRSKISESPSRLKHYCIVIWHFQYNRYIRKLHLSCIDHYDSHVLWKTVNIWRQIPYKYWSLLLISGSFECREVFLSQIYSVVSWRSSGWSDTVKKSKAFGGSQKWTFDSQQSKLLEKKSKPDFHWKIWGSNVCLRRRRLNWAKEWKPWLIRQRLLWSQQGLYWDRDDEHECLFLIISLIFKESAT